MSVHNRRRHYRQRKATRHNADFSRQTQSNPQFMKRTRASTCNGKTTVVGVERLAHRVAVVANVPKVKLPPPARRAPRFPPPNTHASTISSPATTRQPVKKGPSRSQRDHEERRQTRRAKKSES